MRIPRLHLFELADQSWFPATIRDLVTDYLHFVETKFALHQPAASLVAEALQRSDCTRIVDLCSGGGGSIPSLLHALAAQGVRPQVTLTDRFPNTQAFQQVAAASNGQISFRNEPVDARTVPPDMRGLRTMFNAFHHFRPSDAMAVLRDAVQVGQPIGIFEIPDRNLRTLVPVFFLVPLLVAITTPFIRPFRWQRLLWTYLLPLVPLACWWDGIVSQLRAHSPTELQELAEAVGAHTYCWRAGRVPIESNPGCLTYLIGYPDDIERNRAFGFEEHARPPRPRSETMSMSTSRLKM
jgi:hypothetical protein